VFFLIYAYLSPIKFVSFIHSSNFSCISCNNYVVPLNNDLRLKIVDLAMGAGEGHIPSSFSIVDIIDHLYGKVLRIQHVQPNDSTRDYFILSKGHGALALYVVLNKYGLLSTSDLDSYGQRDSKLGGHPDRVSTEFVEASTGSLGHGFPFAVGIALGNQVKNYGNRVIALLGDGECQEGSIWEAANIAANQALSNLVAVVDWNESAMQLMPIDKMAEKWESFGWDVVLIDGHSESELQRVLNRELLDSKTKPYAVIARNIKGKGVPFLEGHGAWHHKIPDLNEYQEILEVLK
jgi:transketolase